jgi:hypothetical protein
VKQKRRGACRAFSVPEIEAYSRVQQGAILLFHAFRAPGFARLYKDCVKLSENVEKRSNSAAQRHIPTIRRMDWEL